MTYLGDRIERATPSDAAETQGFDLVLEAGGAGPVVVPDLAALLQGDYARLGPDLLITAPDGARILLTDYFTAARATADLMGPEGAVLKASVVDALAGPGPAGVQVAQAGDVAPAAAIGTVTRSSGEVFATRADGSRVQLQSGDSVYQGDVLETGPEGAVGLVFIDETEFSLGADGRMVLDEMIYDPDGGAGQSGFSLVSGTFSFVSGEIAKLGPDAMTVDTPVATIGIRGTKGLIRISSEDTDFDGAPDFRLEVALLDTGEIVVSTFQGKTQVLNKVLTGYRVNLSSGLRDFGEEGTAGANTRGQDDDDGGNNGESTENFIVDAQFVQSDPTIVQTVRFLPSTREDLPDDEVIDVVGPADQPGEPQNGPRREEGEERDESLDFQQTFSDDQTQDALQMPPGLTLSEKALNVLRNVLETAGVKVVVDDTDDVQNGPGADDEDDREEGQSPEEDDEDDDHGDDEPVTPEVPQDPEEPEEPETPEEPQTPEEPKDPDTPENPEEPQNPDEPDEPDEPEEPQDPDEPQDPEEPTTGGGGGGGGGGLTFTEVTMEAGTPVNESGSTQNLKVIGTASDDQVTSGSGNDVVSGGAGSDQILTNDGDDTVYGGDGDDTVTGGSGRGNDVYYGGDASTDTSDNDWLIYTSAVNGVTVDLYAGSASGPDIDTDTLSGFEHVESAGGDDKLVGNTKANTLIAGDGADTLVGDAGDDTLKGGLGNDEYRYIDTGRVWGNDTIIDTGGTDTLDLTQASGQEPVAIYITNADSDGTDDDLVIEYADGSRQTIIDHLGAGRLENLRVIDEIDNTTDEYVIRGDAGSATNDLLYGTAGADTLDGGQGNDVLFGNGGDDTLRIAGGEDVAIGGAGNDLYHLNGPVSEVSIEDSEGDNTLQVDKAVDDGVTPRLADAKTWTDADSTVHVSLHYVNGTKIEISGGAVTTYKLETGTGTYTPYAVSIGTTGTTGDDLLLGTDGDEFFAGGTGSDIVAGGAGNDTLVAADGIDTLLGGDGDDTYQVVANATAVVRDSSGYDVLDSTGESVTSLTRDGGQTTITFTNGITFTLDQQDVTAHRIEAVDTTTGLYTLAPDANGTAGNDIVGVTDGVADETLSGGAGDDQILAASDTLDRTLEGGAGDDTLVGGTGTHTYLYTAAGWGADVIRETDDTDTVLGSSADDTIDLSASGVGLPVGGVRDGDDMLLTFAGGESIRLQNWYAGHRVEKLVTAEGTWHLTDLSSNGHRTDATNAEIMIGEETTVSGGDGDDVFFLGNDPAGSNLTPGAGNDTIYGNSAAGGTYTFTGTFGDDVLAALPGNADSIALYTTLTDADMVDGALVLKTESGTITVRDPGGLETLDIFDSSPIIHPVTNDPAATGDRLFIGTTNGDTVAASAGETVILLGAEGNDSFNGAENDDILSGGAGNDTLDGHGGNDMIRGGDGIDSLYGGDGDDTLIFDAADASIDGGLGHDTLKLTGASITLDAATVANVSNIERLKLDSAQAMSALLKTEAFDALVGASGTLYVDDDTVYGGAVDDRLIGDSAWAHTSTYNRPDGVTYEVWTDNGRTLYVESSIDTSLLNPGALPTGSTWIGPDTGGNFETDANWLKNDGLNQAPRDEADAYIDGADVVYGTTEGLVGVSAVHLTGGASLTIAAGALAAYQIHGDDVADSGTYTASVNLTGGTLDLTEAWLDTFAMTGGTFSAYYGVQANTFHLSGGVLNGYVQGMSTSNAISGQVTINNTVDTRAASSYDPVAHTTIHEAVIDGTGSLQAYNGTASIIDSSVNLSEIRYAPSDGGTSFLAVQAAQGDTTIETSTTFEAAVLTMDAAASQTASVTTNGTADFIASLETSTALGSGSLALNVGAGGTLSVGTANLQADITMDIAGTLRAYDETAGYGSGSSSVTWTVDSTLSLTGSGTFAVDGDAWFGSPSETGTISFGSGVTLALTGDGMDGDLQTSLSTDIFDLNEFRIFENLSTVAFDTATELVITADALAAVSDGTLYVTGGTGDTVYFADDTDGIDSVTGASVSDWAQGAEQTVDGISYQTYTNGAGGTVLVQNNDITVTAGAPSAPDVGDTNPYG